MSPTPQSCETCDLWRGMRCRWVPDDAPEWFVPGSIQRGPTQGARCQVWCPKEMETTQ